MLKASEVELPGDDLSDVSREDGRREQRLVGSDRLQDVDAERVERDHAAERERMEDDAADPFGPRKRRQHVLDGKLDHVKGQELELLVTT